MKRLYENNESIIKETKDLCNSKIEVTISTATVHAENTVAENKNGIPRKQRPKR